MTADLKQAAQIALLALEYHTHQTRPIPQTEEAIKALMEALAAPAPQAPGLILSNSTGLEAPAEGDELNEEWAAELLGFQRGVHFAAAGLELKNFSQYNKDRIALVLKGARGALAANVQPKHTPKPCLVSGDCKHGSWCSDVYCQEHCQFVKGADALDALAELCGMATGGWDLPPSAVARIGELARKASAALRAPAPAPEIDYTALMRAGYERHKYSQGTGLCVAFKNGAEWLREQFAAQAPAVVDGWQPIETAPMDGTPFWGWRPRGRTQQGVAYRVPRDDCEMWCFAGSSAAVDIAPDLKPAYWRPLPADPTFDVPVQPMGDSNA